MSGLCGWISTELRREPAAMALADMAAPLNGSQSFNGAQPLRSAGHSLGAMALAAAPAEASLYHQDGLLIASFGVPAEALARLWRAHGARACAALSGHFAFALLDERCAEALLAVDRCATRPLFYRMAGRSLLFASSMEALARHPGAGRELDPQALFDYLYLHAVHGPRTMFAGQRRLAPGECLHLHGGRVERIRYWRMRYTEHAVDPVPHTALLDALSLALDCTPHGSGMAQPAGFMLAGGAGATLAATLLQRGGGAVHTYAIGFGVGDGGILGAARAAARRIGSRHREQIIDGADVADAIAALAQATDAPCGDPAAVAMLFAGRMARADGLERLHGAFGAAQLFGRGRRYAGLAQANRYERLPGALRQLLIEPLLFGPGARLPMLEGLRTRIEQAMAPPLARLRRRNALLSHGTANVFEPAFLELVDPDAPAGAQEEAWWLTQARSAVNCAVDLELQGDLPCRIVPAFAAACAAAGVQAGLPYLDDAVVAMAARLAPRHKSGNGPQRLFAKALRELGAPVPAPAAGAVALPFGRWLLGDARVRALAYDSLSTLAKRRILRREFIDLLLARRLPQDPTAHGQTVWRLLMLEQWLARGRRDGLAAEARGDALALVPG
ncbi:MULTISPECIES: asparagine synthase-related protein [unclassified Massilia]|uniref:asparagine synthase-related protein n=1 Tax=unclassified Massilia TaxID=2609279 RepID=UPI00177AF6A4|nr:MULTISPECIES: asparagine synthase-related protein [unclassified Massilia]MBD8528496.1 asparagine synthase [Massilia sp. CFBP 13647]MBD8671881.1 asparagine synthase [Massilia sp. CFBP 13721]